MRSRCKSLLLWVVFFAGCSLAPQPEVEILVLAAASVAQVVEDQSEIFSREEGVSVIVSSGSSGFLARQIQLGVGADLFLSADTKWVDKLIADGFARAENRRDLLSNQLAVVVPRDASWVPAGPAELLDDALVHLAVGDPETVPAGSYARASLEDLGLWASLEPRLVQAEDVRSALAWVESGLAQAGIVYVTDLHASERVRLAFLLPPDSYEEIVYPLLIPSEAPHPQWARRLAAHLVSPAGQAAFAGAGFIPLVSSGDDR